MLLVKRYKYFQFAASGKKIIQQLLPNHTFKIELDSDKSIWLLICDDKVDFTSDEIKTINKFRRKK